MSNMTMEELRQSAEARGWTVKSANGIVEFRRTPPDVKPEFHSPAMDIALSFFIDVDPDAANHELLKQED